MVIQRIGLGLAFSPTAEAMLREANRLTKALHGTLVVIHVGTHTPANEAKMNALLLAAALNPDMVQIVWETGDPAKAILRACKSEQIDLLITGALKKENLVQYYLGSVARKILRKAPCSVLTVINKQPLKNIVVNAEDSPYVQDAIALAFLLGKREGASWIHIVREIKMYGLTMAASDQLSEEEYDQTRHQLVKDEIEKVERLLVRIPHEGLKVNIKIISGKSGFELVKFAQRKQADLLVVGAPARRFSLFDRFFPHDQEYILADLPCNVLIVKPTDVTKKSSLP
ncbi:MAG: universal stress protein [Bacteroidota bacterium]